MFPEKQQKIAWKLGVAWERTSGILFSGPVALELDTDTYIAQQWNVITSSYSGIEQTFKFLIAVDRSQTVSKLLEDRTFRTHNLHCLFGYLADSVKERLRKHFTRFASLHFDDTDDALMSLDGFLNTISENDGKGYEKWRYSLIEDGPLPTNSPEALTAIWWASVKIAKEPLFPNTQLLMPEQELLQDMKELLCEAYRYVAVEKQNEGDHYREIRPEITAWLNSTDHPLNAFANVLHHHAREETHGVGNASSWLSDVLKRWVELVQKKVKDSGPSDLWAFSMGALGRWYTGHGVRWDSQGSRFAALQWTLDRETRRKPPCAALPYRSIKLGWRLPYLYRAAREAGCQVKESRDFRNLGGHSWVRTLQVGRDDDGWKPVLTVWERVLPHSRMVNGTTISVDGLPPPRPLQRWIDQYKK